MNSENPLEEWLKCPDIRCENPKKVSIDTIPQENNSPLLSFHCEGCGLGAMEDDFYWWVCCPECMKHEDKPFYNEIGYNVLEDGKVQFKCYRCGESISTYPPTKWDSG